MSRHVPISCMSAVSLSFSQLDLNGQTHNNSATEIDGFVDQVDVAELYVTDAASGYETRIDTKTTNPPF